MNIVLIFDNLLSLSLDYYWLGLRLLLALKLKIMIRGGGWGGRFVIRTERRLKDFEKLIIGGKTII